MGDDHAACSDDGLAGDECGVGAEAEAEAETEGERPRCGVGARDTARILLGTAASLSFAQLAEQVELAALHAKKSFSKKG